MSTSGNAGTKSSEVEESSDGKTTLSRDDVVRVSGRRRGSLPVSRPSVPPPPPPPASAAKAISRGAASPPETSTCPSNTPPRKLTPPPSAQNAVAAKVLTRGATSPSETNARPLTPPPSAKNAAAAVAVKALTRGATPPPDTSAGPPSTPPRNSTPPLSAQNAAAPAIAAAVAANALTRGATPPPETSTSPSNTPPRNLTPPPPPPAKPQKKGPPAVAPKPARAVKPLPRKLSHDKDGVVLPTSSPEKLTSVNSHSVKISDSRQSRCVSKVHAQVSNRPLTSSFESEVDHDPAAKVKPSLLRGKARSLDEEPPKPPKRTSSIRGRADVSLSIAGEIRLDKSECNTSKSAVDLTQSVENNNISGAQLLQPNRVSTAGRTPPIVTLGKTREDSPIRDFIENKHLEDTPTSSIATSLKDVSDRVNGKPPPPRRTSSITSRSTLITQISIDTDQLQASKSDDEDISDGKVIDHACKTQDTSSEKETSSPASNLSSADHKVKIVDDSRTSVECGPTSTSKVKCLTLQHEASNSVAKPVPVSATSHTPSKPALELLRQKRTEVETTSVQTSQHRASTLRQSSAFTTEDLDLYSKPRTRGDVISRSMTRVGQVPASRPSGDEVKNIKRDRRRSNSVGVVLPPNLSVFQVANIGRASYKPKVPTKPKFNDKLISGKGLPSMSTPEVNSSLTSSAAFLMSSSSTLSSSSSSLVSSSSTKSSHLTSSRVSTSQVTEITHSSSSPASDFASASHTSTSVTHESRISTSSENISASVSKTGGSSRPPAPNVPAKIGAKLSDNMRRYNSVGGGTGSDSHTDSEVKMNDPHPPPRRKKAIYKRDRGAVGGEGKVDKKDNEEITRRKMGSMPSLNKCNSIQSLQSFDSDSEQNTRKSSKGHTKKRKSGRKSSTSSRSRMNSTGSATCFYVSEDKSLEKEVKVGSAMFYGTDSVSAADKEAAAGTELYENVQRNSQIYGDIEIRKNEAGRNDLDATSKLDQVVPKPLDVSFRHQAPSSSSGSDVEDHVYDNSTPKILMTTRSKEEAFADIYENVRFMGSQAFDDSDSEFDDDSFSDAEVNEIYAKTEAVPVAKEPKDKIEQIATELLNTERAYVKRLHLVDQVFQFRVLVENRASRMFPDNVIPQMFSNIKSIFQFHHDFLLPQLEKRMQDWATTPKVGDLMKTFAPFLKLYSDYVSNFDHAMNEISCWSMKCPRFAAIMEEIHKLPECGSLTLQHHMLEPIQRVPRYKLLLQEYLKRLPEDSDDRTDSEVALKLVATAAEHSNEAMRKNEKFRKLLEINERFGGMVDLISPTRELVKEGKITKISARNGYQHERYLFLFSDLLLLCQNMLIGIKQTYRIKAKLELDGMQVLEGDNLETPDTFIIKSKQKTLELHCNSSEEKLNWQVSLWTVIKDYTRKQLSRRQCIEVTGEARQSSSKFQEQELGLRAPQWVKDQETSMCMQCGCGFSTFKRRHHCRACGIVVCAKCSSQKAALAYDNDKLRRVCDKCYHKLADQGASGPQLIRAPSEVQTIRIKPVLKVKASDPAVIASYLNMSSNKTTWSKRWFAVHEDLVMYSFKAHQDVVAMTSMPLPSYKVEVIERGEGLPYDHVFQLSHAQQKSYYLQAEDKTALDRWVSVLEKVVQAELPDDYVSKKEC